MLLIVIALLFCVLGGRLGFIQIVQAKDLQEKAMGQWTRNLTISANRGNITDRNGIVLAQSAAAWTIVATQHELVEKNMEANARKLADTLALDYDTVLGQFKDSGKSQHVILRKVDKETADAVNALDITGVYCAADTTRKYPAGDLASQIIGFTDVSGQGQTGIEREYDEILRGVDGSVVTEITREQREMPGGNDEYVAPEHGNDIALTIDSNIQYFAASVAREIIEETQAAKVWVGVMDVQTGDLQAMVNEPTFDLNEPPRDDMESLNRLTRNGFIADAYEPGPVFELVTAAAALEAGVADAQAEYNCTGSLLIDGETIRCFRAGLPHGRETLGGAMGNACAPAFVQLAVSMGKDGFYEALSAFGFGSKTGVALRGESAGQVTSIKYVKDVDLARIGVGQDIAVTPLQLLTAGCAVVNGGYLLRPQIIEAITTQAGEVVETPEPEIVGQPVSGATSAAMREMLEGAVSDGAARNAYIPGYRVGGIAGSVQKIDDIDRPVEGAYMSSFIGFAPMDDPKVAVLVVIDEPDARQEYGLTVAAPYARRILEQTLPYLGIHPSYEEGEKELLAEQVQVPDLTEFIISEATSALEELGLRALLDGEEERQVVAQSPEPGTFVPAQSLVILYTDLTPEEEAGDLNVFVPDVSGMTIVEANRVMRHAGLVMRLEGRGLAVSQYPPAGAEVARGSNVEVTFTNPQGE